MCVNNRGVQKPSYTISTVLSEFDKRSGELGKVIGANGGRERKGREEKRGGNGDGEEEGRGVR